MNQDYIPFTIRASSALTTSYVSVIFGPGNYAFPRYNQLILFVDFTKDTATAGFVTIEYSNDGTNWYMDTFSSISGATATMTAGEFSFAATGKYTIMRPFKANYIRISAKGTGTLGTAAMKIEGGLAVA